MRPVNRRDLVVLAVGLAIAAWVLVRSFYGELPPLHWWLAVPLGVLAVAVALGARTLRLRLSAEREARGSAPGRTTAPSRTAGPVRPVEPMLVARVAVIAQAAAWVGAAFAGLWAGALVHVASEIGQLAAATGDTVTASLGVACAVGLALAGLRLESVCRVPPSSGEGEDGPAARA